MVGLRFDFGSWEGESEDVDEIWDQEQSGERAELSQQETMDLSESTQRRDPAVGL